MRTEAHGGIGVLRLIHLHLLDDGTRAQVGRR